MQHDESRARSIDIEAICENFKKQWLAGVDPRIEDVLSRHADLDRAHLLQELPLIEVTIRRKRGETVSATEYSSRFSNQVNDIDVVLSPILSGSAALAETVDVSMSSADETCIPDRSVAAATIVPGSATQPESAADSDTGGKRFGDYELLHEIARGGMGVVYKARQTKLNRIVALKMIRSGELAGQDEILRFRSEAEAAAQLDHPNIVPIFEVGEQDGLQYFSMGFVEGRGLDARLKDEPLLPEEAAKLIKTIAEAIQYANDKGIVHRDLKPANVLIDANGQPHITDFGLAKNIAGDSGMTATGQVVGTPSYMPPEQAAGKTNEIGPLVDVYSLGAMLYALLTGRPPFHAANVMETLKQVCEQEPVSPCKVKPSTPRDLETICLKCLQKSPQLRYSSAGELAGDLGRWIENRPIRARKAGWTERAAKWRQRNKLLATILVLTFTVGAIGGLTGLWYWNAHYRITVQQYSQFVRRFGEPVGVRLLTAEEAQRRSRSFRLYKQNGRVIRVECVNAAGELVDSKDGPALNTSFPSTGKMPPAGPFQFVYEWSSDGRLIKESAQGRSGDVIWTLHYAKDGMAYFSDANGLPCVRTNSGAANVRYEWDDSGWVEKVWFLDRGGKPHPNDSGVYGIHYTRNDDGTIRRVVYLGKDGNSTLNRTHLITEELREYDDWGAIVRETYFDRNQQRTRDSRWVSQREFQYDNAGNRVEGRYFDESGRPCLHKDGNHGYRQRFDDRGQIVGGTFFGINGKPIRVLTGVVSWKNKFDAAGNLVESSYYGIDGKPCLHRDGNHIIRRKFDDRGNQIEGSYFGIKGEPVFRQGFHRFVGTLKGDQEVETAYFGPDGEPVLHEDGNHVVLRTFDDRGNVIEYAYLDTHRRPVLQKFGFAIMREQFDEKGRLEEKRYFGIDGRPCLCKEGNHGFSVRYDESGYERRRDFFGIDGKPVNQKTGIAQMRFRHDAQGNMLEVRYFDADGRPCLHKDGNHGRRVEYDERGNGVVEEFFDVNDKLIYAPSRGYARRISEFDERGLCTLASYFGPDGKPCMHPDGNAAVRRRFNARGQVAEFTYLGLNGQPIPLRAGAARVACEYTATGKLREQRYLNIDGKPAQTVFGFSTRKNRFDARGNEIEVRYFDTAGRPCRAGRGPAMVVKRYDSHDRVIEQMSFDTDGSPLLIGNVHAVRNRYDSRGNVVELMNFDQSLKPCRHVEGHHAIRSTYNERDYLIREDYLDLAGKPALRFRAIASMRRTFDSRGNLTEDAYFDGDGKPVSFRGSHRRSFEYDTFDRRKSVISYDAKGRRVAIQRFDAEGPIDFAVFDADGKPRPLMTVVTRVIPDSLAARLGIRTGDIFQTYNGQPVKNSWLFTRERDKANRDDQPLPLIVLRRGMKRTFLLPPGPLGVVLRNVVGR